MAISNKDKQIWDWWSTSTLLDLNAMHDCSIWDTAKEMACDVGDFVLSKSTFESQLIKELYGR